MTDFSIFFLDLLSYTHHTPKTCHSARPKLHRTTGAPSRRGPGRAMAWGAQRGGWRGSGPTARVPRSPRVRVSPRSRSGHTTGTQSTRTPEPLRDGPAPRPPDSSRSPTGSVLAPLAAATPDPFPPGAAALRPGAEWEPRRSRAAAARGRRSPLVTLLASL